MTKPIKMGLPGQERGALILGRDRNQQLQAFPTSAEPVRASTFPPEILSSSNSCGFSSELLLCLPISVLSGKQKHCFFLFPAVPFYAHWDPDSRRNTHVLGTSREDKDMPAGAWAGDR